MEDVCELYANTVRKQAVVPDLCFGFEWFSGYFGERGEALVHYDCKAISFLPRLEARHLASPKPIFQAGEELILINLC